MAADMILEQVAIPGIGLKILGLFLVSVFFLFWPGLNELSDVVTTYIAESKTGKFTKRIYRTIIVPQRGEEQVLLREMSLDDSEINERMLRLQTWLPTTSERGVQCHQAPSEEDLALKGRSVQESASNKGSELHEAGKDLHALSRSSTQQTGELPSLKVVMSSSSVVSLGSGSAGDLKIFSDDEVLGMLQRGEVAQYSLEKRLGDSFRAVRLRREHFARKVKPDTFQGIPYENYNYDKVVGSCCEVVVGYMPIPLGMVGPLVMDGEKLNVPLATTEGTLVASTNRGCKALTMSGGIETCMIGDGITRAPCVQLPSAKEAAEVKKWLDAEENYGAISQAFNSTTRYGSLSGVKTVMAGRLLYIRMKCFSGDAMGMNMISKGTDKVLEMLCGRFPKIEVVSLSGNFCTDKKPAAVNWIEGRGKSVCAEAVVKGEIVRNVLKSSVSKLVSINYKKNLVGSAMAGSIGGFNAHAANIVAAIFLATGQDPAQVVESSNCITLLEPCNDGADVRISVTMPSVEVGTIGGGTVLEAQGSCLDLLGCRGSAEIPGQNSEKLARVVASTVMCAELSLLSALSVGHLVSAHMKYNRSSANLNIANLLPHGHGQ